MLLRRAPLEALDRDFQDFRRIFGDFGTALLGNQPGRIWAPPLDIWASQNEVHIRVELPGVDVNKDVDIEVSDGVLTISGERHQEQRTEQEGYVRREMSYGRFERSITLPQGADASNVRATYDSGILEVVVPLPQKAANKVKVEVGGGTHRELNAEAGSGEQSGA